jgi:hypothetical protein
MKNVGYYLLVILLGLACLLILTLTKAWIRLQNNGPYFSPDIRP